MEKQTQPVSPSKPRLGLSPRHAVTVAGGILSVLSLTYFQFHSTLPQNAPPSTFDRVQKCAIRNLHQNLSFLGSAEPIKSHEFIERRDRLAQALSDSNVDAFILEPGYTFQYEKHH